MNQERKHQHARAHSTDPVCGMQVGADTEHRHVHEGTEYRFCSAGCLRKFAGDPKAYLHPPPSEAGPNEQHGVPAHKRANSADEGLYTCPMHPEIVQDHPGNCPKCGMTLQPRTVEAEEDTANAVLGDIVSDHRAGLCPFGTG